MNSSVVIVKKLVSSIVNLTGNLEKLNKQTLIGVQSCPDW